MHMSLLLSIIGVIQGVHCAQLPLVLHNYFLKPWPSDPQMTPLLYAVSGFGFRVLGFRCLEL